GPERGGGRVRASPRTPRKKGFRFLAINSYPNPLGMHDPSSCSKGERHMIHESTLGPIGNPPVVRINKLAPPHVTMYVKCEAFNPMSSVKDRLAIAIIEDAERTGAIKPGQTVIEATSGNTGIALAMVCAAKGYPFVATMAESFSIERRKIMRMLGARVILTPAAERGT